MCPVDSSYHLGELPDRIKLTSMFCKISWLWPQNVSEMKSLEHLKTSSNNPSSFIDRSLNMGRLTKLKNNFKNKEICKIRCQRKLTCEQYYLGNGPKATQTYTLFPCPHPVYRHRRSADDWWRSADDST